LNRQRSIVPAVLAGIFLVILLYYAGVYISIYVQTRPPKPTLSTVEMEPASAKKTERGDIHWMIGGVEYEAYQGPHHSRPDRMPPVGEVFAYAEEGRYFNYFAEIQGLDRNAWALVYAEDGTGRPSMDNIKAVLKSVEKDETPEIIAALYEAE